MKPLAFTQEAWKKMISASEAGYPKEVCGLLFGKGGDGQVARVDILSNILDEKHALRLIALKDAGAVTLPEDRIGRGGAFEFLIDPEEHYHKVSQAEKEGFDQVGLFHSHPDHPAEPSATDASQPMLAGWANIIVAVHKGKFKEAGAFVRETEKSPFQPQEIVVK